MNLIKLILWVPALMTLAACATNQSDPLRVEQDFGNSVRHMLNAQIYDPKTITAPSMEPPLGLNNAKAKNVLEAYRNDAVKYNDYQDFSNKSILMNDRFGISSQR